jgi:hypothetical protein
VSLLVVMCQGLHQLRAWVLFCQTRCIKHSADPSLASSSSAASVFLPAVAWPCTLLWLARWGRCMSCCTDHAAQSPTLLPPCCCLLMWCAVVWTCTQLLLGRRGLCASRRTLVCSGIVLNTAAAAVLLHSAVAVPAVAWTCARLWLAQWARCMGRCTSHCFKTRAEFCCCCTGAICARVVAVALTCTRLWLVQ